MSEDSDLFFTILTQELTVFKKMRFYYEILLVKNGHR